MIKRIFYFTLMGRKLLEVLRLHLSRRRWWRRWGEIWGGPPAAETNFLSFRGYTHASPRAHFNFWRTARMIIIQKGRNGPFWRIWSSWLASRILNKDWLVFVCHPGCSIYNTPFEAVYMLLTSGRKRVADETEILLFAFIGGPQPVSDMDTSPSPSLDSPEAF